MSAKRKVGKTSSNSSPGSSAKKNKSNASQVGTPVQLVLEAETQDSVPSPSPSIPDSEAGGNGMKTKVYSFKDPNFSHGFKPQSGRFSKGKGKHWKSLKQIIPSERALPWKPDDTHYWTIDAPPSFKPAKKYSDLSGLLSTYTDPHTKLRFANGEEYSRANLLPSDIVTGLLTLRKANALVP